MHRYTKLGLGVFLFFAFIHIFSKDITWSDVAGWGGQVEATAFYSKQKSLEAICGYLMLLGVGMMLIGLWERRDAVGGRGGVRVPSPLSEEEADGFREWLAGDISRKYHSKQSQVEQYRSYALKGK
ncbi:MAG: hypothetical protein ACSHX6_11265 [Akkermansiaceae bacterium]